MGNPAASILAIQSYLPETRVSNEDLHREWPDWGTQKIFEKTGISERAVASADQTAADLGVLAARKIFESGVCSPSDIDFLLLCTQSPDYFLPTSACLMQSRLGLRTSCGALDFNLGCSGFVYGLSLAKGLIESGSARRVLLVTAETYSKFLRPDDRGTRTIFGDGAAATLIGAVASDREPMGPFIFGTDGSGSDNLIVRGGASRHPQIQGLFPGAADETGALFMNGPEIFNFTLRAVPELVGALLERSRLRLEEVDYFVFHQANKFMLERLRKKIGIPESKFCINLENYGNTVSATIPMALELCWRQGKVQPGERIMLVGFGVGYSWAGCMISLPGPAT